MVTAVWVARALADGERDQLTAAKALKGARAAIRADLANHVVVPLLVFIISFGAIAIVSGIGGSYRSFNEFFAPVDLFASLLQTAVSSAASAWMLAAFAGLASDR
jgi:hypothetical protein